VSIDIKAGEIITAEALADKTGDTVEYTSITANTGTVTTTETVAITTGSVTFTNNRAYEVTIKCLVQSSVAADNVTVRVRKTNVAGATLIDQCRINIPVAAGNYPAYFSNIVTNTTGADITAALVGTYVRTSGSGNSLIAASTTNVAYVRVEDRGLATDHPGAYALA
jgi:hypothetical protein